MIFLKNKNIIRFLMKILKKKCNWNFRENMGKQHVIIILMKMLKNKCNYNFDAHFENKQKRTYNFDETFETTCNQNFDEHFQTKHVLIILMNILQTTKT